MAKVHQPLGPNGEWKTGQRVPEDGNYYDQYGVVTYHEKGSTFAPCLDRKGECAYRLKVDTSQAAATA